MDIEWKNSLSKAERKKPSKAQQLRVINEIEAGISQRDFEACVDLLLCFAPKYIIFTFYNDCFALWSEERKSEWTRSLIGNQRLCENKAGWGTD